MGWETNAGALDSRLRGNDVPGQYRIPLAPWLLGGSQCLALIFCLVSCEEQPKSEPPVAQHRIEEQLESKLQDILGPEDAAAVLDLRTKEIVAEFNSKRLGTPALGGSVMKLLGAAVMLRDRIADEPFACKGRGTIGGKARKCWDPKGHGTVGLARAIAQSCNLYFYQLATRLSPERYLDLARAVGLGRTTGWGDGESSGVLPHALSPEELGDTIVGQTEKVQVTGYQLLRLTAVLSGTGHWGGANHATDEIIRQGMFDATQIGTIAPPKTSVPFAGKTGTARRVGSWRVSGWFVGFAPVPQATHAFVVYARDGVGREAAILGQEVIEATLGAD